VHREASTYQTNPHPPRHFVAHANRRTLEKLSIVRTLPHVPEGNSCHCARGSRCRGRSCRAGEAAPQDHRPGNTPCGVRAQQASRPAGPDAHSNPHSNPGQHHAEAHVPRGGAHCGTRDPARACAKTSCTARHRAPRRVFSCQVPPRKQARAPYHSRCPGDGCRIGVSRFPVALRASRRTRGSRRIGTA
jgi:hypothetical protein